MKKLINPKTFPLLFRAISLSRYNGINPREQKHHYQSKDDNLDKFEIESLRFTDFVYLISLAADSELLFLMLQTTIADKILSCLQDILVVYLTELCCFSVDLSEVEVWRDLEGMVLLWFEVCMLLVQVGLLGLGQ